MSRNKRATNEYTSFFARPLRGPKLAAVHVVYSQVGDLSSSWSLWRQIHPFPRDSDWSFQCRFLSTTAIRWNGSAFRPIEIGVKTKLVPRPITTTRVEGLEVKFFFQSKCPVFVTILRGKLPQNNQFLWNFCLWGWWAAASSLIWSNFFSVLCGKCSEDTEICELCELWIRTTASC